MIIVCGLIVSGYSGLGDSPSRESSFPGVQTRLYYDRLLLPSLVLVEHREHLGGLSGPHACICVSELSHLTLFQS